jgi:hypothetical protein
MIRLLAAGIAVVFAAFAQVAQAGPGREIQWRALVASGDDSIAVFDNAVDAMSKTLADRGVAPIDRFTSDPQLVRFDRGMTTVENIAAALKAGPARPGQGCFVFLTSHGSRHGLLLRRDLDHARRLEPVELARMLEEGCGSAPTVAIISGCYSGIFISAVTKAPNRIILTAARNDRTSFGCGAEERFTYFDDCLLQSWPKTETWAALYQATHACVRVKESTLGVLPSEPQAYFGAAVTGLPLPSRQADQQRDLHSQIRVLPKVQ